MLLFIKPEQNSRKVQTMTLLDTMPAIMPGTSFIFFTHLGEILYVTYRFRTENM